MGKFTQRILALVFLILLSPAILFLIILIKLDSRGAAIFRQKRMGKNKKTYLMYKFRVMVEGAEKLKKKFLHLNEADGPVFKIWDDPRHTKVGRFLAHTGLDELPQLINIIKGEMAFVGPRPLPLDEANEVPKKYQKRFSVLPGITSSWVVQGSHNLTFDEWMKLDLEYVSNRSFWLNLKVMILTVWIIAKGMFLPIADVFK